MKENPESSLNAEEVIKSDNSGKINNSWRKYKSKRVDMLKSHREIEQNEFLASRSEIDNELEFLGVDENNNQNGNLERNFVLEDKLSKAKEVKEYFKQLKGEPSVLILKKLISNYESDSRLSPWVKNWKNFLSLQNFAQDKPPKERKAIEAIIRDSDFSNENSFDFALVKIQRNNDISTETKIEVQKRFNITQVKTIRDFDQRLRQEQKYKRNFEKQIQLKRSNIKNLEEEIQNLESELDNLTSNDSRRRNIEEKLKEKNLLLESHKDELVILNKNTPKNVKFQLRDDMIGMLNDDGSRSVKIESENFSIKLPSNKLPFTGEKNLRSINIAFPYLALKSLGVADEIFAPDLVNNSTPTKGQRVMAHLILSSLGIDDSNILSENEILMLKNDLSFLIDIKSGKTGKESLIELGVYDLSKQKVNKPQFKQILNYLKENRNDMINFKNLKLL